MPNKPKPKLKPIVVVGSLNMDLVAYAPKIPNPGETLAGTEFKTYSGGKGANQAVAVARLGYPVRMIGRVGDDPFAVELTEALIHEGVDVQHLRRTEGSSGIALIVVGETGDNSIVVVPGANASLTPGDIDASVEAIRNAGIVLAQLETPLDTVLHLARICKRENVPLILDPAPACELPPELFALVDWFTPNESEASFFAGDADEASSSPGKGATVRRLRSLGVRNTVLKMGAHGVHLSLQRADGPYESYSVPAFAVTSVDTTAAGDTFNGAFAVGLMLSKTPIESAQFASAAAAVSVTRLGAQTSMPTLLEVEELLHLYRTEEGQQ